jgi:hypothetical protein
MESPETNPDAVETDASMCWDQNGMQIKNASSSQVAGRDADIVIAARKSADVAIAPNTPPCRFEEVRHFVPSVRLLQSLIGGVSPG